MPDCETKSTVIAIHPNDSSELELLVKAFAKQTGKHPHAVRRDVLQWVLCEGMRAAWRDLVE